MNPHRMICGLATVFGTAGDRPVFGQRVLQAEQFERFIGAELGADMMLDHQPVITSSGVTLTIGKVPRFASVSAPAPGLLILAVFDKGDVPDCLLDAVRTDPPGEWGLSIGAWVYEDGQGLGVGEVSLTRSPAFDDARVLAVGAAAADTWELLVGEDVRDQVGATGRGA